MLVHDLRLFKERKNKVGQTKRKKKFENKSLPLCILESCVCFSSILSTAIFGGFLTCKEFDTAQSVAFGKSLWSVYDHPQVFSEVPSSLCLNLFFPVGHPTLPPLAEHQKLFVLSAEQRPKPLFSKEKPDIVKAGNLFTVLFRISVSSPHDLRAFPCRSLGTFHLIKTHMQQRFPKQQILCDVKCHIEVTLLFH